MYILYLSISSNNISYVVSLWSINFREVEDFARRLNSDWPERMQEILSLGQEGRLTPISVNGNGSLRRCPSSTCRISHLYISTRLFCEIP